MPERSTGPMPRGRHGCCDSFVRLLFTASLASIGRCRCRPTSGRCMLQRVRPRYIVRKERRIYVEHHLSGEDDVIRGDVAVLSTGKPRERPSHAPLSSPGSITPVVVRLPVPEEIREAFLTLRERDTLDSIREP